MDYRIKYFIESLILSFSLGVLFPFYSSAQDKLSPVQFHGTNVLVGQYSNMQRDNSMTDRNYMRNDLQMTLSVYDVPFATSFYLTSEESDMKQRISNLGFSVDLNTLKKNKARIESINKKKNLNDTRAPWRLRFLSKFSKIEAGRFRPNYGDLTLNRIPVSGVNLEFTDKLIYAAFTTGQTKQNVEGNDSTRQFYKQNLIFGKLGIGEKMKNHFYLTYMDVNDEAPLQSQNIEMMDTTLNPMSNKIFGMEFRLALFKYHWIIDGEAGFSSVTRDTRIEQDPDSVDIDFLPDFIIPIVNPNISSSFDYAYGFSTKIILQTTSISGGYRWIGPGYYTLGNPNLVNDLKTIEGKIDQGLFKRKVNLSAFYKNYNDNLLNTKEDTTTTDSYGIIAKLTVRKFPFIQISYTPYRQKTSVNRANNFKVINLTTGYNYSINKIRSYTGFSYFNQNSDYENEIISNQSNNQTYTVNQSLSFTVPIQFNFNMGYATVSQTQYDVNILSVAFRGTHTYKKNWKNTLGLNYMKSGTENKSITENNPLYTTRDDNKFGLFWESQIKIWKGGDLGVSIKKNTYENKEESSQNFNEWVVQSKLAIKW